MMYKRQSYYGLLYGLQSDFFLPALLNCILNTIQFTHFRYMLVKNPLAMQETLVQFLRWKIPWRRDRLPTPGFLGFPDGSDSKESTCNAGDLGLIIWLGSSLEEGLATYSSIPAWRTPWTEEPGGPWSHRVGHD